MNAKTQYIGRIQGRLKVWSDNIDRLALEAKKNDQAKREELERHIQELRAHRDEVERQLLTAADMEADEAAWEEIRDRLDRAIERFDHAINQAFDKVSS